MTQVPPEILARGIKIKPGTECLQRGPVWVLIARNPPSEKSPVKFLFLFL